MLRRFWIGVGLVLCAESVRADTLVLANGDEITGEIIEWAVDYVVIDHPQLGELRLALDQLELDTGEAPSPGLFGTRFLRGWSRNINFGLNGKTGNSENTNMTLGLDCHSPDAFKRWKLNGRYFFNADDGGTTDNNARLDLRRDWLVPESHWFGFASMRYQYDEFEAWEHRITAGGGPGFHVVQKEHHLLDAMSGLFFTREFKSRNKNKGEALFGLEYTWTPASRYTVRLSNQAFFQVTPKAGELRNVSLGELKILLTEDPSLNFIVGAENEYETETDPGDKANDLKYYVTLGLDF
jgi:hypothetical protein